MIPSSSAVKHPKRATVAPAHSLRRSLLPVEALDRRTLLVSLGIIAAVCVCYYPVIHNGFVNYDDKQYITDNPHVQEGLTWATVQWAFTSFYASNWHPLTWLSHALDCNLFGTNAVGPHCVNVLLQAVNGVLLFLLLQTSTGSCGRSLMVAALFALHPIIVESVAWAAERKTVLSAMFFLLAFHAYVWYTHQPGRRRNAFVAAFYALALMCKPQVITFPFLLLLWDYWPLNRAGGSAGLSSSQNGSSRLLQTRQLVLEKAPLFLLSALSAVVTMWAQNKGHAVRDLAYFGFLLRLENVAIAYVSYLGKALWPSTLVAIYPHPAQLYPIWQVWTSVLFLLLITVLVVSTRGRRYLIVGWLWFLGSLVPMIGLVQVGEQAFADRYAYISFIGLFLMAVWLVWDWVYGQVDGPRADNRQVRLPRWVLLSALCCVLPLGMLTWRQVSYWHDSESFWRRTLALSNDNYVAHENLANLLHEAGKNDEALVHTRAVLTIRPNDPIANMILGDYERARSNPAAAIEYYQVVALKSASVPARAKAYANMASCYLQMDQPKNAKQSLESSLELLPRQSKLLLTLGMIAQLDSDLDAAVGDYTRAIAVEPSGVGYALLANALRKQGRANEADAAVQRAASLSKNLAQAQKQAEALLAGK